MPMRKIISRFFILICFFALVNKNANAQNLIPNPSFEQNQNCLFAINQYNSIDSCVVNWTDPIDNFTQYFNPCNADSNYRTPLSGGAYQAAKDGNAYVGISMIAKNASDTTDYHQYIQTKFTQHLIIGKKYSFKMYVNLADSMEFDGSGGQSMVFACNNVGVFFSTWKAFFNHTSISNPIYIKPQLLFTQVVKDTANWTELSQTFIADSAYEYITIGNFMHDYQCKIDTISQPHIYATGVIGAAVFFIDDLSLVEDTSSGIEKITTNEKLKVFPNPVINQLTVIGNQSRTFGSVNTIEVTNLLGQQQNVKVEKLTTENCQLTTENLPSGIYFIKATDTKGNVKIGKFVKE
ncbi:MAG: hypothetical protein RJA07_1770 [Bacteroidota bacterium]|jgi:hypothetical protein